MSIHNRINHVWRNVWSTHARINGVWRDINSAVRIDGVWRDNYQCTIQAEDILGFHIVYLYNENKTHPDFPYLNTTHDLPAILELTGQNVGSMDCSTKGIMFEYAREYPYKEGIIAYDAHLYAELLDGTYIDFGFTKAPGETDERVQDPLGINEAWSSSKVSNLNITIDGQTIHKCHGFYTAGWNNLFSTTENIINIAELHGDGETNVQSIISYPILPLASRSADFSPIASIGIARDMHTEGKNMVGSYGRLDHTISHIYANGEEKPFVIEYYG